MVSSIRTFLKLESAGGILLLAAAGLAMICANTVLTSLYDGLLQMPVGILFGSFQIHKPLLLWINDGLMVMFFFLIGLELKRELVEGELSDPPNVVLPALGALGGMVVPGIIYWWFNHDIPEGLNGWAIPMATDTAFALGILALLGRRVPLPLKIFLVSLAIFDDIGAILLVAFFFTSNLSPEMLWIAASCLVLLFCLNGFGVMSILAYALVGAVMWAAVLKSGVHATLVGILLAMFIPLTDPKQTDYSPLRLLDMTSIRWLPLAHYHYSPSSMPVST